MKITNDSEADETVQRALVMMLDEVDGLDDPEDTNPIFEKARRLHEATLAYYRDQGHADKVTEQKAHLAYISAQIVDTSWIEPEVEAAEKVVTQSGDSDAVLIALDRLAELQPKRAIQHRIRTVQKAREAGKLDDLVYETQKLTRHYSEAREQEIAMGLLRDLAEELTREGHKQHAARALRQLGDFYEAYDQNKVDRAVPTYEKAADFAREAGDIDSLAFTLIDLLMLYDETGATERFEAALRELTEIEPKLGLHAQMSAEDEIKHWKRA
ncbi:hypothetical protein [Thalassococcus sp. S3]|uniref:hypothetical protein n=1 Tax=Thalassococcus sp. S3 TaxID=2017482 RepID=UPI0013EE9F93|nr:hypothetical protein [Thalassococcus sp. S3]